MPRAPLSSFLARNPFPNGLTDGLFYREKMRAIHRVAPPQLASDGSCGRILDVGGGRSGLAALLYPDACVVTLDVDAASAGQGPTSAASAFVCGDATRLPFGDGAFDAVALFDVLEHIPDDAAAAREALRVVRPAGVVLVSTPTAAWRYPYYGALKRVCPDETELMAEWGHVRRGYSQPELCRLFGGPPESRASFINPLTALYHDVSFSRLKGRARKAAYAAAAPLVGLGYVLHGPRTPGAEIAAAWRR
jgi:SAM-dependent methyltransferase